MEIKITVNVGGNDPIEVKVDVPVEGERNRHKPDTYPDAKWFDESCLGWTRNSEMNKLFLIQQQTYCNEKLRSRGYLFLNEVYDALGIPRTARGQILGWVYDIHNPIGDNFVDFGLYEDHNRKFVNGLSNKVLLNFNVDGDILKYL